MQATSAGLPSGTVTFLFTDIEGSTRLLRELDELYDDVLDLHHRLLREVWARHGGVEVNTEGDAFFVAFGDASDALAAAVDGQRAIGNALWPAGREVLVRMGMHTGYARPVDGDYRALAVHQAARVVNAANGGQVFATDEVVDAAAAERSRADIDVERIGLFRVRDFDEPIALHQVSAPDLPAVSTPPRVLPADRHNLVRPTTSLVDRVAEQAELSGLLEPGRLVTLHGPGGAGKTRLSVEVGFTVVDRWPDGVWFVDLAPLSTGDVAPAAVADALNARSVPGNEALSDLIAHLADRTALLVFDNCEHLIEPVAALSNTILERCPGVGILATSRIPLGLVGERTFRLDPLATDDAGSAAIQLFVERTDLGPDADLTEIVGLCRDLDGLPLAIEIAATRAHLITPSEMHARLQSGVAVLSTRDPTLPDRQRSLSRLLDWTIDILTTDERAALTRLAVIADDFDGDLADAVVGDATIPIESVAELVWSLVDWSLVAREIAAGSTRYSLLSTVRSHVLQRAEEGEVMESRRRLATYLMDRVGPRHSLSRTLVTDIDVELDNIRAVVADDGVSDEIARALAWSIGQYHDVRAFYRTGISEVARCVEQRPKPGPDLVALLTLQADLHLRLGETSAAEGIIDRASALAGQVGSADWDDMGVARARGELALRSDEPEEAIRIAEEALKTDGISPRGQARLWNLHAIATHAIGDIAASCVALEHCLRAEREAGLDTFSANTHGNFAEALIELGDRAGAAVHQLAALDAARSTGQTAAIAVSLMIAARFAHENGDPSGAVRLQVGADDIMAKGGHSLYASDERLRARLLAEAQGALGPDGFARASAVGHDTTIDQLADEAAAILQTRTTSAPSQEEHEP